MCKALGKLDWTLRQNIVTIQCRMHICICRYIPIGGFIIGDNEQVNIRQTPPVELDQQISSLSTQVLQRLYKKKTLHQKYTDHVINKSAFKQNDGSLRTNSNLNIVSFSSTSSKFSPNPTPCTVNGELINEKPWIGFKPRHTIPLQSNPQWCDEQKEKKKEFESLLGWSCGFLRMGVKWG